jgi:predicted N-acetyltransferase YhbS
MMEIRETTEKDKKAIHALHSNAFDEEEAESVAQLAVDLLEDATARPLLSLVAEVDGEIVGHVIFSSISVEGGCVDNGYIMAPLAVSGNCQGKGVGSGLIRNGLETLESRGAGFVLVLGDPDYYRRSGFGAGHGLRPPYDLDYPEAWMAIELDRGALSDVEGVVRCADCLMAPEHW